MLNVCTAHVYALVDHAGGRRGRLCFAVILVIGFLLGAVPRETDATPTFYASGLGEVGYNAALWTVNPSTGEGTLVGQTRRTFNTVVSPTIQFMTSCTPRG